MDYPLPPTPRIDRIAANLSSIPPELIEPVIDKLELGNVLALAVSPAAGPVLLDAIGNSPAWDWLFRYGGDTSGFNRLKNAWIVFNQLAFFQKRPLRALLATGRCGFDITTQFRDDHRKIRYVTRVSWSYYPEQPKARAKYFIEDVEEVLVDAFEGLLKGIFCQHLPALCIFLPIEPLGVLRNPKTMEGSSAHPKYWHFLRRSPTEDVLVRRASELVEAKFTMDEVRVFLPALMRAGRLLQEAQAAELHSLAGLFDQYPDALKSPPLAPDTPRRNKKHIQDSLRRDSKRALTRPFRPSKRPGPGWGRFRHPHPTLIPYNWCLRLFKFMVDAHPIDGDRYPPDLIQDFSRANKSFAFIRQHGTQEGKYERVIRSGDEISHVYDLRGARGLPSPEEEILWLESFLRCVQWIASELPDHAAWFKGTLPDGLSALQIPVKYSPRVLLDEEDYRRFIESEIPEVIAKQLCADVEACRADATRLPSLLALYLPKFPNPPATEVAKYLVPGHHISVQQLVYEDTMRKVKSWIMNAARTEPLHADGATLVSDPDGPLSDGHLSGTGWDRSVRDYLPATSRPVPSTSNWKCYICKLGNGPIHRIFSSMCEACGDFNLAGSALSLPRNLDLAGKVAVVTGGRINLGYHTALRLLRCGACVIVTSRYPRDAASRYQSQHDWKTWNDRLKIVGADFRAANDAFGLVEAIKEIVTSMWGGKLDILVNNAAQTLTDSIETEERAADKELLLAGQEEMFGETLVGNLYKARVRGIVEGPSASASLLSSGGRPEVDTSSVRATSLIPAVQNLQLATTTEGSSWVQSLSQIPYEDIISAHSVNTFVPLILVRELLELMRQKSSGKETTATTTTGYIINVSSREGIFESSRNSNAKRGKHVHTNMSKAGLNMITETEAATTWKSHRIAMNTVDPGYMSAAPEFQDAYNGERPIGWEDGAGRVLWPVAMGEKEGVVVWGRFLKHYGAVRVDVRFGRG
ncbi:uncharacterized protein DNG_04333 [Cephalotrichum gorgonifer]|uniref:Adh_short domain-containing protein n=1 Tax=Cephalotrichum gorgonifer TaxID=2041049 RepID=A0AAE8MYL3_9PEZI|nr:uncharacterized protein DNG_04333 [Cephalotrichum gorgonifer]